MKANVSPLARSLAISLCHLLPPREHGDRDAVVAAEPKIHPNRVPWSDSSKPQPHHELLYVYDPTAIPFSPQVDLPVSAAPLGRHDRRPLLPLLSLALASVCDAEAC